MDENLTRFDQDWHVSSTFSDGSSTVAENVHAAEALGLESLCVVDKASRASGWVRDLAEACSDAGRDASLKLTCGIEVEVVDTNGTLEAPPYAPQVDYLFVAADRLPTPTGPVEPEVARAQIALGDLLPSQAVEWLVRAYANASLGSGQIVLAHPFSVLSRLGMSQQSVHPAYVRWLAGMLLEHGASVEVNELWRAPTAQVLDCLLTAGVPALPGSGARSLQELGHNEWYRGLLRGLSSLARVA
jgi:putative hydrolase